MLSDHELFKLPSVVLPLTFGKGDSEKVPMSSGLNWGQRPGREQNQAYLSVPSEVQKSNFFPDTGIRFLMKTDDGVQWECARRQANGKAIHSIKNNSLIGCYFRKRLKVDLGDLVTISHLLRYGRTNLTIYKTGTYSFILDFRPNA
jgi:hypothetical protein